MNAFPMMDNRDLSPNNKYDDIVPKKNGFTLRLPCILTTISFLSSVAKKNDIAHDFDDHTSTFGSTTTRTDVTTATSHCHCHPSVDDVIDALYLQSAIPQSMSSFCHTDITQDHPRVIHVVGKEENHVQQCIDEACGISLVHSFFGYFVLTLLLFLALYWLTLNSHHPLRINSGYAIIPHRRPCCILGPS